MSRWHCLPAVLVLVLAGTLMGVCSATAASLSLQGNELFVTRDAVRQVLPKDVGFLLPVQNAPLRAVQLLPDEAKARDLEPGLYLFDPQGALTVFLPDENNAPCGAVALSPGGKVLAVDTGTWVVRSWSFYTYPALKPLGGVTYLDDGKPLIWHGDNTVIVHTQEDVEQKRQCDYDPCGPVSVERVDLWPFTVTPLFKGTDLCDYTITSFKESHLAATETCSPTLDGWSQLTDPSRTTRALTKMLQE